MADTDDDVDAWLPWICGHIAFLEDFGLDNEVALDFTPDSLRHVEGFVVDRFRTPAEMLADDQEWIVDGVIGYLGETLLRLAGGRWCVPDHPEQVFRQLPAIMADPALGLPQVSPADLVVAAVRSRSEDSFQRLYLSWQRAVRTHQAIDPLWTMTRQPTPGIDPAEVDPADVEYLETWLATQARDFPAWVVEWGGGVAWDFSPESLDALALLVLGRMKTREDFADPAHAVFLGGACWYLGETMLRLHPGRWDYVSGDEEVAAYVGHPFVVQLPPRKERDVPLRDLRVMVKRADPHLLRLRWEMLGE